MHKNTAIKVDNVSKSFKLPHEKHGSLKHVFLNLFRNRSAYERQEVLEGVDFEIEKGEFFGIIGRNGNGKSTLLKMLAGIYAPDRGHIHIKGKLTPFIELGVGFNPELTGRENVFLNGALLGFSQKEMEEMYGDIVEFAELEKFMDQKLKNYSSGMQVRLAFSIAIRAKSDILLIDEVLAVGDVNFQKKCIEVFEKLKNEGRTIVFVSHSMGYIRDFCDRVAVVNEGKLVFVGDTERAVDIYNKINVDDENQRTILLNNIKNDKVERLGNGKARINKYEFFGPDGKETKSLTSGEKFRVELDIEFFDEVTNPAIGIMFRKNSHENLFGINNFYDNINFGKFQKGDRFSFIAQGMMPLAPGTYSASFTVAEARSVSDYSELDTLNEVVKVNINGTLRWGLLNVDIKMEIRE